MAGYTKGHGQGNLLKEMTVALSDRSFNERDGDVVEPTASCYWDVSEVNVSETSCVVHPNKELSNSEIQPKMERAALLAFSKVNDIRE